LLCDLLFNPSALIVGGKKMSGKKMKIGFGEIAAPPLSAHAAFFTSHFFAINAVEKESRQRVTRFTTSAASI
jgi:hypothetical protein